MSYYGFRADQNKAAQKKLDRKRQNAAASRKYRANKKKR